MALKVGVIGAAGKMGKMVCQSIMAEDDLELTAAFDPSNQGQDVGLIAGGRENGVLIAKRIEDILDKQTVDVIVDFTIAKAAVVNIPKALKAGINVVVGTTSISDEEWAEFDKLAKENNVGLFFAANYAIGAVLMMQFAEQAAKYLPDVEVIELHHDQKLDAPSGTAVTTLKRIAAVRGEKIQGNPAEYEKIAGSRGGNYAGMHVHSVRLPGYVAHQEVIFGGIGQTLTIRHDSISRESFMPGVMLAVKKVVTFKGLVRDLDSIM